MFEYQSLNSVVRVTFLDKLLNLIDGGINFTSMYFLKTYFTF